MVNRRLFDLRSFFHLVHDRYASLPSYKMVRFGSFQRVTPIQRGFEYGRGKFIDRYYIDQFMQQRSDRIRGRVLEIGDDIYTRLFGTDHVTGCDILDVRSDAARATIIGDLTSPNCLTANTYDCAIVAQTLNYIYEVKAATQSLFRALRPGGALLVTVSGIAQIAPQEKDYCGDFWRFTSASLRRLLEEFFPPERVEVVPYGNVLSALSFLHGLGAEELKDKDLDFNDPEYQLVICALAVKPVTAEHDFDFRAGHDLHRAEKDLLAPGLGDNSV
jgi:hypothetical protein